MSGEFVFLNENHYNNKDGQYRSYSTFADTKGQVHNFNSSGIAGKDWPQPFSVCLCDFDLQTYGNNGQALVLHSFEVVGIASFSKEGK